MLGNPLSKHGAVMMSKDPEGAIYMFTDIMKITLEANGIEITPQIEQEILDHFKKEKEDYDKEILLKGIPEKFITLFNFDVKRKLLISAQCRLQLRLRI